MDETRQSVLGIISTILSVFAGIGIVFILVVAGIVGSRNNGNIVDPTTAALIGFGILSMPLIHLVALGLGVGGLFQANTSKIFPIVGIVLVVGVLIFGMIIRSQA